MNSYVNSLTLHLNFSGYLEPEKLRREAPVTLHDAAFVYVSVAGDRFDKRIFSQTKPIPVLPGADMIGAVDITFWKRLKSTILATLGISVSTGSACFS